MRTYLYLTRTCGKAQTSSPRGEAAGPDWLVVRAVVRDGRAVIREPFKRMGSTESDAAMSWLSSVDLPLADSLSLVDPQGGVNVEIEDDEAAEKVVSVIHELIFRHNWNYTQFVVSSEHYAQLRHVRKLDHHIKVSLLVNGTSAYAADLAQEIGAYAIHVERSLVTPDLVKHSHNMGLMVFVYPVDDTAHMESLARMGVDGIFSSHPDRVARWTRGHAPVCPAPETIAVTSA
ncbi:MAG: hypothetical protein GF331_27460 [Chitinivibrionales bacterium]|nr:hypothetical protein [Chitinivibrionales bacterium]